MDWLTLLALLACPFRLGNRSVRPLPLSGFCRSGFSRKCPKPSPQLLFTFISL